jgi:hypothetical protein
MKQSANTPHAVHNWFLPSMWPFKRLNKNGARVMRAPFGSFMLSADAYLQVLNVADLDLMIVPSLYSTL